MANKESVHAAALRALGFEQIDGIVISRSVRRALIAKGAKPTFTKSQGDLFLITFATDELGQSWTAQGHHDLTSLGFIDNTEAAARHLRAARQKDPRYH